MFVLDFKSALGKMSEINQKETVDTKKPSTGPDQEAPSAACEIGFEFGNELLPAAAEQDRAEESEQEDDGTRFRGTIRADIDAVDYDRFA